ncbi:MAG: hypothetical protein AAF939_10660 [Planctomycetota bacterium]
MDRRSVILGIGLVMAFSFFTWAYFQCDRSYQDAAEVERVTSRCKQLLSELTYYQELNQTIAIADARMESANTIYSAARSAGIEVENVDLSLSKERRRDDLSIEQWVISDLKFDFQLSQALIFIDSVLKNSPHYFQSLGMSKTDKGSFDGIWQFRFRLGLIKEKIER